MIAPPVAVPATDQAFIVRLETFSGPLDLLLHLIREQEIDIADIPIARIADQFLESIHALGLNEAADYLDMAAYLLRIKVQMLLPRRFDAEEWEDPRAELVRRLLEYEQIREVAHWIADQVSQRSEQFPRGWIPDPPERPRAPITVHLEEILQAVERVLEAMPQPVLHRVVVRPLDVEGATRRIVTMLDRRARLDFQELLGEEPTIADVLSVLLALLELARVGRILLHQDRPFSAVAVTRESTDAAA